jgi:hypothetical protein
VAIYTPINGRFPVEKVIVGQKNYNNKKNKMRIVPEARAI